MAEESRSIEVITLTALIVGGVILFGFTVYVVIAFFVWIVTHPEWLVYAFLTLVVGQSTWLVMASLKKRFDARSVASDSTDLPLSTPPQSPPSEPRPV